MPINLRAAAPGVSRLAQALGGGAYDRGYEDQLGLQSRLAQAMASVRAHDASALANQAKADQDSAETTVLRSRPGLVEETIAAGAGTDIPMVRAIRQHLANPTPPMGPPDEQGRMGGVSFDPALKSKVLMELRRALPVLTGVKDIKPDDYAKSLETYRGMDLGDDVLSGRMSAGAVGASQAALAGKPLFNSDSNGAVLDLFGGKLATDNPMAASTIGLRGAQAGQAKAGAAENYAQAANANASAEKTRAEMKDGNRGGNKAPTGYRWTSEGELEPIKGGPADPATKGAKLAKPPTEGQGKALAFASRMQVADEALNDLAEGGVDEPSRIKQLAESLPVVGTGAGMAANAIASPKQQQVEQAQRNFINAVLRRESGAVISPEEFRNAARQYFPQPNDDADTKRNKAINRRVSTEAMKAEFGEQFLPDFDRIVSEARTARKTNKPKQGSSFASPAEAEAAAAAGKIKPGDRITVGGQSGTWQ